MLGVACGAKSVWTYLQCMTFFQLSLCCILVAVICRQTCLSETCIHLMLVDISKWLVMLTVSGPKSNYTLRRILPP